MAEKKILNTKVIDLSKKLDLNDFFKPKLRIASTPTASDLDDAVSYYRQDS